MEKLIFKNSEIDYEKLDEKSKRKVLSRGGSMMAVEVHFKAGGVGEAHSHEAHEQLSYILAGKFEIRVGEETMILKEGDSFYAPFNTVHGVKALEDSIILDIFTPQRQEFLG